MSKFKLSCLIICLLLGLTMFGGLVSQQTIAAQSEEESSLPEERVEFEVTYPVRRGPADSSFSFPIKLSYIGGEEPQNFELLATGPPGWTTRITQSINETEQVSAIRLDPSSTYPQNLAVTAISPYWLYPEPGDYTIKLEAAAGDVKSSVDLTARITARYGFLAETETGRLNIKATAGKESYFTIILTNSGTDDFNKITFYSSKPSGIANEEWRITFNPDKIESLAPLEQREIEVTVQPPSKAIAGDYMTTLQFDTDPNTSTAPPELDIRVTVGTATRWGWIGAGIVVAVVAGLAVGFKKLGRR
ncbi:MAG: hypothetical protein JW732_03065 [Dehalococcoidia bacterium]|nr:hypothetical protein [Dehalococcoidia bacterium]